jgi:hypothetical protein
MVRLQLKDEAVRNCRQRVGWSWVGVHHVKTILRYVDSTVTMLCHLRAPALLMRAHPGMEEAAGAPSSFAV